MSIERKVCPRILSAAEAAALIPNGAHIAVSGFGGTGVANTIHRALTERCARVDAPCKLTYIHAAGHILNQGGDLLAAHGMLDKVIGGHWGLMPALRQKISAEEVEAHNWPQGVVVDSFRAAACGKTAGLRSHIGLGTFVDPRQKGGCANERARRAGSLIRLIKEDGQEILEYAPLKPDFALIRGWSADHLGNVSLGMEPVSLSIEYIAMATRRNGGQVICQVRTIDHNTTYSADRVTLPGFLIDVLVKAERPEVEHRQCEAFDINPAMINLESKTSLETPKVPQGPRGWIGRRASMEVQSGNVLNLGIGIPGDVVGAALHETGRLEEVVSTLESGVFGGVALGGNNFGSSLYPHARLDQSSMFDLYHGGGLDIAIMGAAEIDVDGNINVSQFGGRATGCGGFIDITQSARRVVFCSTLTAGGLEASYENGKVCILKEGKHRKFIRKVEQITFNGSRAFSSKQSVILITERCVFDFYEKGWRLIEVAPGIDIEQQILSQMDFLPTISSSIKAMPPYCFSL